MHKGEKRPSWFKLFLHQKPIIDSVPDDVVGKAVKAAFHYFATKEEMELDVLSMVVYSSFKPYIEESFTDYERDVRNGHKGGRPQKPPVTPGKGGLPSPTQAEAEADADAEAEKETGNKADKPHTRHKYGSYKNVLFTDEEYDKLQAEFPGDYSERIERLSEYIASTGKSYKSHLATIRSWARKDGTKAGSMPSYGGEENWSL
jgi:hypothetical protein